MACTVLLQEQIMGQKLLITIKIEWLQHATSSRKIPTRGQLACVGNSLHAVLMQLSPAGLVTIARVAAADRQNDFETTHLLSVPVIGVPKQLMAELNGNLLR